MCITIEAETKIYLDVNGIYLQTEVLLKNECAIVWKSLPDVVILQIVFSISAFFGNILRIVGNISALFGNIL